MCNCLKEVSKKMEAQIKSNIEQKSKIAEYDDTVGFLENEGFGMSGTVLFLPFTVRYKRKKVNGETEQNWQTQKNNVMISFCPFCGTKIDEKKGF